MTTSSWSLGRSIGALAAAALVSGCVTVSDAPLRTKPSARPGPAFAVWYTGVGGFGEPDRRVIEHLTKRGISVVEVNSRDYFWRRRTPEEAAAALDDIIRRYDEAWPDRKLAIIGYSFGGAAVPMILPHLDPDLRDRIELVVLVAPSPKGQLVMRPWTLVDVFQPGDPSTADTAKAIEAPVLCIYGVKDRLAACPSLTNATVVAIPGGHHLNGQAGAIAEAVSRALGAAAEEPSRRRRRGHAKRQVTPPSPETEIPPGAVQR
jgi:type IV secretory pathway VirJ component